MALNGDIRVRPSAADRPRAASLASVARDAAGDLIDLVGAQIRLVRAEIGADVRAAVARLVKVALFVPVLLVGYAFAMAALASGLAPLWGWTLALIAVATLQLAVGGAGLYWSLSGLRGTRVLNHAAAEATDTLHAIEAVPVAAHPRRTSDV